MLRLRRSRALRADGAAGAVMRAIGGTDAELPGNAELNPMRLDLYLRNHSTSKEFDDE